MIYPNTQPSGIVGGQDDNKRKLQQMLSQLHAAPLFGSSGKSASVASLPSVGAPSLSYNPFLKMLAGRPGETFNSLPAGISQAIAAGVQNGPTNGYLGSSVPTTGPAAQAAVAAPASAGLSAAQNPYDFNANASSLGHFFDTKPNPDGSAPAGYAPSAPGPSISPSSPFYHTLLQLALYGQDR